ncbi:MAG: hypothetical protein K8S25_11460 [Alphaproteobacteria bacterium]|nr:hypothetical protein [Alphaproteobacteria bacterium]
MTRVVDPRLRLSAQRALLGAICPAVRLIKVALCEREIVFSVVAAARLSAAEREALSVAAAEILSDFPDCTIKEEMVVDDGAIAREDVLVHGWVYLRAE